MMPEGYCSQPCETAEDCGASGSCWNLGLDSSMCLLNCRRGGDCREAHGYICDGDSTCFPGEANPPPPPGEGTVGDACAGDGDCDGAGAQCIPEQDGAFPGGYCVNFGCSEQQPCPAGSGCFQLEDGNTVCLAVCNGSDDCRAGYACQEPGVCLTGCEDDDACEGDQVCNDEGLCADPPCTPDSCPEGTICAPSGLCTLDLGEAPGGAVPNCDDVHSWECEGGEAACGRLSQFLPERGPGYWNYPLNGETPADQYRSFCRRDLQDLVKYASAKVECLAQNWAFGNHEPLGLGDMSESNGAIPGTREGQPGHPEGTHTNGPDIDIAYYQLNAADNRLRAICNHSINGRDQYHCVEAPRDLDVWRTALWLAFAHDTPQLRVIGVDGQVGQLVDSAITQLCDAGWYAGSACRRANRKLAYEVEDTQRGWYRFHHHHFHLSLGSRRGAGLNASFNPVSGPDACLRRDCAPAEHGHHWSAEPLPNLSLPRR